MTAAGIYVEKDDSWNDHGWTSIPNAVIRHPHLSPDAKWAFSWFASHTETYRIKADDLAEGGNKGRNHARNCIRELEEHGWLTRHKIRNEETGRYDVIKYKLHPAPVAEDQRTFKPSTAKPRKFPTSGGKEPATDQAGAGDGEPDNRSSAPATDGAGAGQRGAGQSVTDQSGALYKEEKTTREDQEDSSSEAAPPREDVEQLCHRLRERMIENGCKPPTITDAWRTAARLLLDKDGRDLDKALNLIDWATRDEFWMANVQSMGKFRQQYDTLRLRAIQDYRRKTGATRRSQTAVAMESVDDAFAQYRAELAAADVQAFGVGV